MEHRYGVGSEYSQRDLNRFFPTTGVCWTYPQMGFRPEVAQLLLDAFCADFGVQARDLGVGVFLSKTDSPLGPDQECRGLCIYDGAQGSLRLTERLASHLPEVVGSAIELARVNDDEASLEELLELQGYVSAFEVSHVTGGTGELTSESDWYPVVAIGERAMFVSSSGSEDVVVKDYRYTPQGLMYELESKGQLTRMVKWETVQPLHGETRMIRYNVMTGETQG